MANNKKLFYKIGEVSDLCGLPPHVLRYWETEFSLLSPDKNRSGQRIYRERDVELIRLIQRLVHEEGYTISGANKKLLEDRSSKNLPLFRANDARVPKDVFKRIKKDLEEILKLLNSSS